MKKSFLLLPLLLSASGADAATVYAFWSFQTLQNPTSESPGGFQETVTAETFPGTPSISRTGSAFQQTGGASTFTAFDGTTWTGSGTSAIPGQSYGFNPSSNASFTITLNMTGLENLMLRMDIRSAISAGATRTTAFSAIEYNVGDGFQTAASGASLNFGATDNNFVPYSLDLSGLSEISNASSVELRFTLPTLPTNTSVRIDNLQLSATEIIPEPSALSLVGLALGCVAMRRKRR